MGRFEQILLILVLALLLFGGDRLPGVGKALGTALSEFKKAMGGQPDNPNPQTTAVTPAPRKTRRAPVRKSRSKK